MFPCSTKPANVMTRFFILLHTYVQEQIPNKDRNGHKHTKDIKAMPCSNGAAKQHIQNNVNTTNSPRAMTT